MKINVLMVYLFVTFMGSCYFLYEMYPKLGLVSETMMIFGMLIFIIGIDLGIFITYLFCKKYMLSAKAYKRELEKESVASVEASSQVKVLEQKIEVLEKALKQALEK